MVRIEAPQQHRLQHAKHHRRQVGAPLLLDLLRETLHLCSPWGRLRTVEGVSAELMLLLNLIQEIDDEISPFALSTLHILNFKLPIKISTQPQPLQDGFLHP